MEAKKKERKKGFEEEEERNHIKISGMVHEGLF